MTTGGELVYDYSADSIRHYFLSIRGMEHRDCSALRSAVDVDLIKTIGHGERTWVAPCITWERPGRGRWVVVRYCNRFMGEVNARTLALAIAMLDRAITVALVERELRRQV